MAYSKRRFRITPFSWLMIFLCVLFVLGLAILAYGLDHPAPILTYSI